MNLHILLLIPLAVILFILLVRQPSQVRVVSLAGSVIQLIYSLLLLAAYRNERKTGNTSQMLFEQQASWYPDWGISFHTGADGISVAMILLTALVVTAGVLVSWNLSERVKEFFIMLQLLAAGAYGFFISVDLLLLFFFLEIAVIPKYLLIGIWGSGKKEYSANKLVLMLMGGSALILVGMLGMYYHSGIQSFNWMHLNLQPLPVDVQLIFFPCLFIGFGVFTAIFPFHTWVPDGHSSAPTAGSMFLAGISMKLGGYGCLRVATCLMPDAAIVYAPYVVGLAVIAIVYGAFATMMQTDLKYINAYSSVSHCGFVLLGAGMLTRTAITGAVMQMVSHGLMTALFFAVIGMIYERTHTRMVKEMGGLMKSMPFICTILFIAGLTSLGLPGFSGFVAEMTVFIGSWQNPHPFYRFATVLACASIVVTAVYILRAAGRVAMGPAVLTGSEIKAAVADAAWNERMAAYLLVAAILAIGIVPFWLNDLISPDAGLVIEKILTGSNR